MLDNLDMSEWEDLSKVNEYESTCDDEVNLVDDSEEEKLEKFEKINYYKQAYKSQKFINRMKISKLIEEL